MLSRIIGEDIELVMRLADEKMQIMADIGQVEQVLMNIAANARDAMPHGGSLTISTEMRELDGAFVAANGYGTPGKYALISLTDTGTGINAENQSRIFEPFFTTKGVGEGTGLGLSIAYGIIKQHSGYIKVYSEAGAGATFKLFLPLVDETREPGQKAAELKPPRGGTETVLLAEDDPMLRKMTRIVLESAGYRVIPAEDGEDAVAKFREHGDTIQLLVFDLIMPKKNGKEAYEEIRNIRPGIKTLFTSGYSMDVISKKEMLDQGVDILQKPVLSKELLTKVRETLDK
jgi:CheY-like chemotaxis protein